MSKLQKTDSIINIFVNAYSFIKANWVIIKSTLIGGFSGMSLAILEHLPLTIVYLATLFGAIGFLILKEKIFGKKEDTEIKTKINSEFIETCVTYDVDTLGNGFKLSENKQKSKNIKRSMIYDKPISIDGFIYAPIVNIFDQKFPYNKVKFASCDGQGFKDISYKAIHTEVDNDLLCVFEFGELTIKADEMKNLKRFAIEYHGK